MIPISYKPPTQPLLLNDTPFAFLHSLIMPRLSSFLTLESPSLAESRLRFVTAVFPDLPQSKSKRSR